MATDKYNRSVASRWHAMPGFGKSKILALMPKCCRGRMVSAACARTMALLLLLACVHPAGAATDDECAVGLQALHNSSYADQIREDWHALHESYTKYNGCDNSVLDGMHSQAVGELLAGQWQQIRRLEELGDKDPAFVDWALDEGISAEMPQDKLGAIYENASDRCPAGLEKLCGRIIMRQATGMGLKFARLSDSMYELTVEDGAMEVKARMREVDQADCSYTDRWLAMKSGRGEYECPSTVVDKLEATCNGRSRYVPPMAYSDIIDVHEMRVWGDGCYSARIDIKTAAGCSYLHLRYNVLHKRNDTRSCRADVDEVTYNYTYHATEDRYEFSIPEKEEHSHIPVAGGEWFTVFMTEGSPRIKRGSRDIYMPISAYNDLHDIKSISVESIHGYNMNVVLVHGESYTAFLFIEDKFLARKVLLPDPNAGHMREETEYNYNWDET